MLMWGIAVRFLHAYSFELHLPLPKNGKELIFFVKKKILFAIPILFFLFLREPFQNDASNYFSHSTKKATSFKMQMLLVVKGNQLTLDLVMSQN